MHTPHSRCSTSTLVLLAITAILSGGHTLPAQTLGGNKDLVPGLLVLRAMRAALGTTVPVDRVSIGAEDRVREDRDAAELLMDLGPARCQAEARSDAIIILCRRLGPYEIEQHLRYFKITGGWLGRLAREALAPPDSTSVLVLGGGPPLVVSADQVSTAARLFDIDIDGFGIGGRHPTDQERSSGVGWVIEFSSGKGAPSTTRGGG